MGGDMAGLPPIVQILDKLKQIGASAAHHNRVKQKLEKELEEEGFPIITGSTSLAPYDWMTDFLRGLKGIMLDMYRNPEKLLAAIDLFTPLALQAPLMAAQRSGNPRVFMALHRGAAGFMSNEQFAKFYWPGLKKVILAIIDAGLTPMPFFEGDYTPRLEFLAELPKGKVAGRFHIVDLKKFKEILGDTMCFWGNVPPTLLVTGKPRQVKDYVKMLIDTFADSGGLIVDGGAGIPKECRPENVEAMTEAVFEYGVYK
jgi:uroporphyrinogen-III decarboxylase